MSVTGKDSALIGDLQESNFRILEDGNPVAVKFFASADAPAQVLVLVETGPAVYLIEREHLIAAYSLLGRPGGRRSGSAGHLRSVRAGAAAFTTDKIMLARAMGGLEYTLGMANLNFYDSVAASLDSLAALPGKRAMVVLSTGLDSTSEDRGTRSRPSSGPATSTFSSSRWAARCAIRTPTTNATATKKSKKHFGRRRGQRWLSPDPAQRRN